MYLSGVSDTQVAVELFTLATAPGEFERLPMRLRQPPTSAPHVYYAYVPVPRSASEYTARLMVQIEGVAIPLEDNHIRWQE